LSWLLSALPVEVTAVATLDDPENLSAIIRFDDGSIAHLAYLTEGHPRYPKEVIRAFGGGTISTFHNFLRTETWRTGPRRHRVSARGVDKGQKSQLTAFVESVVEGAPMPISLDSLVRTTKATLAVAESVLTGRSVQLG
jgi:predicted dehydrogenase